ncbi:hypothetical protein IFM89_023658 [Coptis chinensis]|uniref:Protein kinase domain-containing protein n=1 Tax=Coptis chinensis TaxID=261450 RepID=A0A835LS75_9MAGN|nr:hypothetical protein IFM89_023658 [Coptis chinensis]
MKTSDSVELVLVLLVVLFLEINLCASPDEPSGSGYVKICKSSVAGTLLAVLVVLVIVCLLLIIMKYVVKNRIQKSAKGKVNCTWSGFYRFSKAEIEHAMNFSRRKVSLGAGNAGHVYKGILPSGQVVVIKHIFRKNNTPDSFTRELEALSRIRHPNLVSLLGCCSENSELYLVYEYCCNGNLAQHLTKRESTLSWAKRVEILRDCAKALRFLHRYPEGCIVHKAIKLTNVLLTEDMKPKLSDFGLAELLEMEETMPIYRGHRGSIGYIDPEYMSTAKLTCASDIYSLGMIMLQLLSGRKLIELDLDARDQLTRKAKDVVMRKRPLADFEDPRLNGYLNVEDFESILQLAVLCSSKSSKLRPTIDVVLEELDKIWNRTKGSEKAKNKTSSATPLSKSLELMEV